MKKNILAIVITLVGTLAYAQTTNVGIGNNNPQYKLDVTGDVNTSLGYKVSGAAAAGQFLRGNGTYFVSGAIQTTDVPGGSGFYIQNQVGSDQAGGFRITGNGLFNGGSVGIGTVTPNVSAALDMSSVANKGFSLPNVALTSSSDAVTISSPLKGLLVFNTGSGGLTPAGIYQNIGTSLAPNWDLLNTSTGAVQNVSGTLPIVAGGTLSNPNISIQQSNTSTNGYLSSTDWNTFNNKLSTALANTNIWIGDGTGTAQQHTMSSDATLNNLGQLTLTTVNSDIGTWGTATQVPQFTVDGKGRITAASNVTITGTAPGGPAGGDLTGTYPNPTIAANKVVDGDIRQSAGFSVIGRTGPTTGNVADITGSAGQVLRVTSLGTALGFGAIDGNAFGSQTSNFVFAAPNGSSGVPVFRALVGADLPSGSGSYIQNTVSTQTANFNISGNGTIGSSLNLTSEATPSTQIMVVGCTGSNCWTNANGIIGFIGSGVNHGQIAFYPNSAAFALINSSSGGPGNDYGALSQTLNFEDLWAGNAYLKGNGGIGLSNPGARLTIRAGGTDPGTYDDGKVLFATGSYGSGQGYDGGVEFRHDNLTQGIGFGYNTIYASGSNTNQDLNLIAKGSSQLTLQAYGGVTGGVSIGTSAAGGKLNVSGDFYNQELIGSQASVGSNPSTQFIAPNAGATVLTLPAPATGNSVTVTKNDVSGVNGSSFLIVANVNVSGNDIQFANGIGGYQTVQSTAHGVASYTITLQRSPDNSTWTNLYSASSICGIAVGDWYMQYNGIVNQAAGTPISGDEYLVPSNVSLSYFDDLGAGTWYYRLVFTPSGYNKTNNGNGYQITDRNLNVIQIKR